MGKLDVSEIRQHLAYKVTEVVRELLTFEDVEASLKPGLDGWNLMYLGCVLHVLWVGLSNLSSANLDLTYLIEISENK